MSSAGYQYFFTHFGLRENPFHVSPDPRFYHSTAAHESAMNELLFGLETRQGLLVLTGEAGTGKTTLLNAILESLEHRQISTSYVFHSLLDPIELFEFVLRDFGVSYPSMRKGDLVRALYDWLIARTAVGDLPVLIVDEAQSLSLETLDELRLLLNLETPRGKLLQVILAGQSELEDKLRRTELRQLRQRVMFHCKLPVLTEEESIAYVHAHLRVAGVENVELFPNDTLQCIHWHSKGIPRLINLLCEHALITAYGEQQQFVSSDLIQRIAIDFDLSSKPISVQNESSHGAFGRLISFPLVEKEGEAVQRRIDSEPVQALIDAALLTVAEIPKENGAKLPATMPAPASLAEPPSTIPPLAQQPSFVTQLLMEPVQKPQPHRRVSPSSFRKYWRGVGESFAADCRQLRDSLTASNPEAVLPEDPNEKSSLQRNLILPVTNWLRQPMAGGHVAVTGRPTRTATQK